MRKGKMTLEETLDIWLDITKSGMKDKDIIAKHGVASATYYRIKKCEGRYSFLCGKFKDKIEIENEIAKIHKEIEILTKRVNELEKQLKD